MKSFVLSMCTLAMLCVASAGEAREKRGVYSGLGAGYYSAPSYHSSASFYHTPSYSSYHHAPAARLLAVNKLVEVPQVVSVRKVVTVPQVVTVSKVIAPSYSGYASW